MLHLYTKNNILHHAYCIIGDKDAVVQELENFLKKELQFPIVGNPDFFYGEYDTLDIEDARNLKEMHLNKPATGDRKIFVLAANFIGEKAQNAMLKLFEEPAGDTHFFLVLPSLNNILPTLRSRMIIINHIGTSIVLIDPKLFLQNTPALRLEEIKTLMKRIADEEESKIEVIKFLNALEVELKKQIHVSWENATMFEEIEKVRSYASKQSPSLKMILEHLALLLPVLNK